MANLCQVEEKPAAAEDLYKQAIALSEKVGDPIGASSDMFNLALLLAKQGRLSEARSLLERVIEIEEQVGSPSIEQTRQTLAQVMGEIDADDRC